MQEAKAQGEDQKEIVSDGEIQEPHQQEAPADVGAHKDSTEAEGGEGDHHQETEMHEAQAEVEELYDAPVT